MSIVTESEDMRRLIAANIRLARKRAELSQDDLADLLGFGTTRNEVSRWETGRRSPTLRSRVALATALGVELAFFETEHPAETEAT